MRITRWYEFIVAEFRLEKGRLIIINVFTALKNDWKALRQLAILLEDYDPVMTKWIGVD
jgi:hypothetical protein